MIYRLFQARYASGLIDFTTRRVAVALVAGYRPNAEHRTMANVTGVLSKKELGGQQWVSDGEWEVFQADPAIWPDAYNADGAVFYFTDDEELIRHMDVTKRPVFRLNFPSGLLAFRLREE